MGRIEMTDIDIHHNPICLEYANLTRAIADAVRAGDYEEARSRSEERDMLAAEHPVEAFEWEKYYDTLETQRLS